MRKKMKSKTATTRVSPATKLGTGQESIARVLPLGQESIAIVRAVPNNRRPADARHLAERR